MLIMTEVDGNLQWYFSSGMRADISAGINN